MVARIQSGWRNLPTARRYALEVLILGGGIMAAYLASQVGLNAYFGGPKSMQPVSFLVAEALRWEDSGIVLLLGHQGLALIIVLVSSVRDRFLEPSIMGGLGVSALEMARIVEAECGLGSSGFWRYELRLLSSLVWLPYFLYYTNCTNASSREWFCKVLWYARHLLGTAVILLCARGFWVYADRVHNQYLRASAVSFLGLAVFVVWRDIRAGRPEACRRSP